MSNNKWEVKTHEEKPNWGEGDYDEYYEIVNERGDSIQTTDNFDSLQIIADALNTFEGNLRIITTCEVNLHCENMLMKMELSQLREERGRMKTVMEKCLEWVADVKQKDIALDDKKGMALYHIKHLIIGALK